MNKQFEEEYFKNVYRGDYLKRNPPYKLKSFLKKVLSFKKKGTLLDIGCAYGLFLTYVHPHFECYGVDISEHAIENAKKRLPKKIQLSVGSVENLNFKHKFDVICCFDTLEHVSDLDLALKVIKVHLKKGGIVVLLVPVYDGLMGKLVDIADKDDTHVHKEGRTFWREKLKEKGFQIELYEGVFRYFLFRRIYLYWAAKVIRGCSPAVMLIGRK